MPGVADGDALAHQQHPAAPFQEQAPEQAAQGLDSRAPVDNQLVLETDSLRHALVSRFPVNSR